MPTPVRVAFPILLLAAVYGGSPVLSLVGLDAVGLPWDTWIIVALVAGLANVVNACLERSEGSARRLALWNMVLKLCLIPFYVVVFVLAAVLSLAMTVQPGLLFATPIVAGVLFLVDYVLLLCTSSYGFSAVTRSYRRGMLSGVAALTHVLLHLMFITDVIAAIGLYATLRRLDDARLHTPGASVDPASRATGQPAR